MPETKLTHGVEAVSGYLAEPSGTPRGNVVVIQEWWGVNAHIKSIADRYAAAGYRAFAPDLYDGYVATTADEASHKMNHLDWGRSVGLVKTAVAALKEKGGKVAVTGYCMGGALTILAGIKLGAAFDAAIPFYGMPPAEAGSAADIKVPVLAHFANIDDWCTPARVDELEATMKKGGVRISMHRYDAQHAFCNNARPEVYVEAAAKLAWERNLKFLGEHIG